MDNLPCLGDFVYCVFENIECEEGNEYFYTEKTKVSSLTITRKGTFVEVEMLGVPRLPLWRVYPTRERAEEAIEKMTAAIKKSHEHRLALFFGDSCSPILTIQGVGNNKCEISTNPYCKALFVSSPNCDGMVKTKKKLWDVVDEIIAICEKNGRDLTNAVERLAITEEVVA